MAVSASLTFANVKSSAMTPRHPEVPNLMGEVVLNPAPVLIARYFSLSRHASKAIIMRPQQTKEESKKESRKMPRSKARYLRVVLVTSPSLALARKIARAVVQKRL